VAVPFGKTSSHLAFFDERQVESTVAQVLSLRFLGSSKAMNDDAATVPIHRGDDMSSLADLAKERGALVTTLVAASLSLSLDLDSHG